MTENLTETAHRHIVVVEGFSAHRRAACYTCGWLSDSYPLSTKRKDVGALANEHRATAGEFHYGR